MMMSADTALRASPPTITGVRKRSNTAEKRTGRSRTSKLNEASAVATTVVNAIVDITLRSNDRASTRITGQCQR